MKRKIHKKIHIEEGENISLTGLMGSGKSSVGRTLARLLKRQFIDTDYVIEKEEGKSITEIFAKDGEDYFREVEKRVIKEALNNKGAIVSLGGGAIVNDESREYIKSHSKLITLVASPEDLIDRVKRRNTRPLLQDVDQAAKLKQLWKERKKAYLDSHLQIDTAQKEIDEIAEEIIETLGIKKVTNHCITVKLDREPNKYNIRFKKLSQLNLSALNLGKKILIVSQEPIAEHYLNKVKDILKAQFNVSTLKIENGEEAKNFFTYQVIIQKCLDNKLERNDTILALGGGVVGDISGFAASTYMRGINLIQIPTTLLAMIDSSVGGKTAINVSEGKNLIGTFYQPTKVVIDVGLLKTLPDKEFKSGIGELIKYALLGSKWDILLGESFMSFIARNSEKFLKKDRQILQDTIEHCVKIKANIVAQDETEKGLRAHLNLGHTFGHALEELTEYKRYSHGEAVAIGTMCACLLAEKLKQIKKSDLERVKRLMNDYKLDYALPKDIDIGKMIEAFSRDKKVQDGKVRFVLPCRKLGRVDIFTDIDNKLLIETLEQAKKL